MLSQTYLVKCSFEPFLGLRNMKFIFNVRTDRRRSWILNLASTNRLPWEVTVEAVAVDAVAVDVEDVTATVANAKVVNVETAVNAVEEVLER